MPKGTRANPVPYVCEDCHADCLATKTGVVPSRCPECLLRDRRAKNRARQDADRAAWKASGIQNPYEFKHRMKRYGLDPEEVQAYKDKNGPVCDACGDAGEWGTGGIAVDHCHERLVFRGLLCHPCNVALGLLKNSPERIRALLRYSEDRC